MRLVERPQLATLETRLKEEPRAIICILGPRQCGKTTMVRQALDRTDLPSLYLSADEPEAAFTAGSSVLAAGLPGFKAEYAEAEARDRPWLVQHWDIARSAAKLSPGGFILALDEIHYIQGWSRTIKGLWDKDRWDGTPLHVVLLGSTPWLMQHGLNESLMGRFEVIRLPHWSYTEMARAFGFTLDEYIYFGGYPGAAPFIREGLRWRTKILDSYVRPVLERDVPSLRRVRKPALFRQVFELGCTYSGQVLSYNKMLGSLQAAGNTDTLADYLELLSQIELVRGLRHYSETHLGRRRRNPKLTVLNTALMSAICDHSFTEAKSDRSHWGRLVESAVGAHLCNSSDADMGVYYWREANLEVDFVVRLGRRRLAIEVKSGQRLRYAEGLAAFTRKVERATTILVGTGGMPLSEFFSMPARDLFDTI